MFKIEFLFATTVSVTVLIFSLFLFGCQSSERAMDVDSRPVSSVHSTTADKYDTGSVKNRFQHTPMREFRAAWVATVGNIDWPSEPGLTVEQQKNEMIDLLNRAASLHLNAIIFQVRPAADALYHSPYEPWSSFLTGKMGQGPLPEYDPLEFTIREAHKRGLQLHAWFNPYRAGHPMIKSDYSPDHISHTHPGFVHQYGEFLWLDPGLPEVRQHTMNVILDVVKRYDIDGVHFDDYFYPYPSYADNADFPDSLAWQKALDAGSTLTRDDWRRENVNLLIKELSHKIKELKPHVVFGISPFGVWRPGHPSNTTGFDAFKELYADAKRWLNEGWVDYFTPQIYYQIGQVSQPFPMMLNWWAEQNIHDRHIWPGLYTSRLRSSDNTWPTEEIIGQIYTARAFPGVTGSVHFSMKPFLENSAGINRTLAAGPYALPSLIPSTQWLDVETPSKPDLTFYDYRDFWRATFDSAFPNDVSWWVLRSKINEKWETDIYPGMVSDVTFYGGESMIRPDTLYLSAINRAGIESVMSEFISKQERQVNNLMDRNVIIIRRSEWSEQNPRGYEANAIRIHVGNRDTLRFRDLTLIPVQMIKMMAFPDRLLKIDLGEVQDGDNYSESLSIQLHKNGVVEKRSLQTGQSINWYGYHITLLSIDFGQQLAQFELATTGSLPVNRAALLEAGGPENRLRVSHKVNQIVLHTTQAINRDDSTHQANSVNYLNELLERETTTNNWWDLPYHFYIDKQGDIYEGRNRLYSGEAMGHFDPRGSIIISLIETGLDEFQEGITEAQLKALTTLTSKLIREYDLTTNDIYSLSALDNGIENDQILRHLIENGSLQQMIIQKLSEVDP
ncbi:MAG: family 10 glycosylhydrolase [Balneolaceae bacterium]